MKTFASLGLTASLLIGSTSCQRTTGNAGSSNNDSIVTAASNVQEPPKLTNERVQRAVDNVLAWTQKGGRAIVLGVQHLPQESAARADIRFDGFQYNSDQAGTPISKNKKPPKKPDVNSRNFYDEMFKYGTQQTKTSTYSGSGVATIKHYNDGRWVLTGVNFNFNTINANVEVLRYPEND
jgi:hypothetical protein